MKSLYKKSKASQAGKCNLILTGCITLFILIFITPVYHVTAQAVLFDFDNTPIYTPLPVTNTVGGITAHLTGAYSIQDANVLGFTPQGFAGHSIYPNSINLADLFIGFDQTLIDFSIMYACNELGCDDAATMRVTAFMNGSFVGTNTRTATFPGTWPVDTLSCSFAQGFDSVVIHYDSPPPLCQDYGTIYMADNMWVTAFNTGISNPEMFIEGLITPNPVSLSATISFTLFQSQNINVSVYDITGRVVKELYDGHLSAGVQNLNLKLNDEVMDGVYDLKITGEHFTHTWKFVVAK